MDDVLADFGDFCFSLFMTYVGALEFLIILRHLVHWSGRHDLDDESDAQNLQNLKEKLRQRLEVAKEHELKANANVMQDGVAYQDGYRIDVAQKEIEDLKAEILNIEARIKRRAEMEAELARQRKIRDETKKQLERAEAELALKRAKEAEEEKRKEQQAISEEAENLRRLLAAEKQREAEEKQREEDEENARKILAAEKQREEEQRRLEESEAAERQRQENIANEEAENSRKLLEAERARTEQQAREEQAAAEAEAEKARRLEAEAQAAAEEAENTRKLLEAERERAEQQAREEAEEERRQQDEEEENMRKLLEAEKEQEAKQAREEQEAAELEEAQTENDEAPQEDLDDSEENTQNYGSRISQKLFEAEKLRQSLEDEEELYSDDEPVEPLALQAPRKKQRKQKLIEENARKFLEAEQEMVQKMLESTQQAEPLSAEPVVEEPIMKRTQAHVASARPPSEGGLTTTVKTQFGQGSNESFTLSTKPLLFPGVSDDASSNEPNSSKQSSFSTQPSEELTAGTGTDDAIRTVITTSLMTPQQERQDPDGEDTNTPTLQYDEEYLRSLDGIKHRPLMREDGSGRRRAFKKRRSSGSSNSSRDSRTSREEELKMFTSLEEEELRSSQSGEPDFAPIKYTNEPATLKVKTHHHRRHKRSPAKDARMPDEIQRTSLEMLGEENSNPWGEVVPEHYKNTEFWRREKAMSIDEEEIELEHPIAGKQAEPDNATNNKINSSSFEEATHEQNEAAMSAMTQQPKEADTEGSQVEGASGEDKNKSENNDRTNLQTSNESEGSASPARSSASPRLRRSPRIDEMNQYEERWKESETLAAAEQQQASSQSQAQPKTPTTPKINIQAANDEPWRDEYGLIMQGLSDFYDFQASVNPSRSRDASRNASPASSQPSSPLPKDVSYNLEQNSNCNSTTVFDIYDDTGDDGAVDATPKFDVYDDTGKFQNNTEVLIKTLHDDQLIQLNSLEVRENIITNEHHEAPQIVADDEASSQSAQSSQNCLPAIHIECSDTADESQMTESSKEDMSAFVQSLRNERSRGSRSRSRSPLPSADNLERSLEARRSKLIKHNEEIFEKLTHSTTLTVSTDQQMQQSVTADNDTPEDINQSLSVDRRRSRSRSPLPTMDNVERSLEKRRSKRIQKNDELFEKLAGKSDANLNRSEHSSRSRSCSPRPTADYNELHSQYSSDTSESEAAADEKAEMNALVASLRTNPRRSRSRSPLPTMENIERSLETRRSKLIQHNDEVAEKLALKNEGTPECEVQSDEMKTADREEMNALVASLRVAQTRSRSRSPLPTAINIERSLEVRRNKLIQHNDELLERNAEKTDFKFESPTITVEIVEETLTVQDDECFKDQEMCGLVASLRAARSRSRSKSPMPESNTQQNAGDFKDKEMSLLVASMRAARSRSKSPMPMATNQRSKSPEIFIEYIDDSDMNEVIVRTQFEDRYNRSRTPSRSHSPTPAHSSSPEDLDFHRLLNLESSHNRTLAKESEELESILAAKQRHLDDEALFMLKTAQEETELRVMSPSELLSSSNSCEEDIETNDQLGELPAAKTARLQKLRCTPTTPDYERSRSEEWKDVQRMKNEMLASGFKRSTYVGESLELGYEYEQWRRETAEFQRSKSPSPSFSAETAETGDVRLNAAERRRIQENILNELITSSSNNNNSTNAHIDDENRNGAKPKHISVKDEDAEGSMEDMRREMSRFQRSRSRSRSPLDERAALEVAAIEAEAVKREIQDRILENFSDVATLSFQNFQDFSRCLNANFLDDRRASDSAMIVQFRENDGTFEFEPEEYHHYRRFSLCQEQQVEEYPEDDYVYVSEIEVQTPTGTRTWLREDYYSESLESLQMAFENDEQNDAVLHEAYEAVIHDEDETDGSEDERQTVVEVDDEIDTDICDFNERGPTDESHHEQSECEEAERAMDHYAGREAADWQEVSDVSDIFPSNETRNDEEGAVGGTTTDSDSFAIDQIYDDAIKNRKQSGILREFDSILLEMQKSYEQNSTREDIDDKERYALWAKTRALERAAGSGRRKSATVTFIEAEKRDTEMRYLGDANMTARQSTRLRSRYGYVPVLQNNSADADVNVDLNYKPKREYNWRKNFKLDEDEDENINAEASAESNYVMNYVHKNGEYYELGAVGGDDGGDENDDGFDARKYSLGGESITLYSRSPDREEIYDEQLENELLENRYGANEQEYKEFKEIKELKENKENVTPLAEKPKKKKSKKKSLRGSKEQLERQLSKDEDDSDSQMGSQMGSRRSSSLQMETDSPKRKSRSRRSSRSSVTTNDDTNSLFSPRSSVGFVDGVLLADGGLETSVEPVKKKIKKRKKVKENFSKTHDIKEEQEQPDFVPALAPTTMAAVTASAAITPDSANCHILAALSPQQSLCVTPASTESEKSLKSCHLNENKSNVAAPATTLSITTTTVTTTTTTPTNSSTLESFDMLKDANFYPLF